MSLITPSATSAESLATEQINAEQVATWLSRNSDFFIGRTSLLASLELEHSCGDSESLLLYQLKLLREELHQHQQKHERLLNNARDNEIRLKRIEQLLVKLLAAENTAELISFLQEELQQNFAIPFLAVWGHSNNDLPRVSEEHQWQQLALLNNKSSVNLQLDENKARLLGLDNLQQGSAIICHLRSTDSLGILVLAHPSSNHFRQQDTLFVEYLGTIISSLVCRHQR